MKKSKAKITPIKKEPWTITTFGRVHPLSKSGIGAPNVPIQSKDEYNFVLGSSSTSNKDVQKETLTSNNVPAASIGIYYRENIFY